MRNTKTIVLACGLAGALAFPAAPVAGEATLPEQLARGQEHWEAGDLEQARRTFEQAVAAFPEAESARMKLAGLLLGSGHYREAVRTYQQAIGLNPDNALAFVGLGMAYLHLDRDALAHVALKKALTLAPAREPELAPLLAMLEQRLRLANPSPPEEK